MALDASFSGRAPVSRELLGWVAQAVLSDARDLAARLGAGEADAPRLEDDVRRVAHELAETGWPRGLVANAARGR